MSSVVNWSSGLTASCTAGPVVRQQGQRWPMTI